MNYLDYKKFLRDALEVKKRKDPQLSFSRLADSARIQRSYLSQVLNGPIHLNSDQLYLIARRLGVAAHETDYLLLLLEIERCSVPERKQELVAKREQMRSKSLKTENYVAHENAEVSAKNLTRYYCDPLIPMAHMFLTLPEYQKNPSKLAARLGITPQHLTQVFSILEECEVIRFDAKGAQVLRAHLHLDKESPLSKVNGSFFRLKSIESLQRERNPDDYFFTATFSATDSVRLKIKEQFLSFLKKQSREIENAPSEEVFQMNFDLFRF